MIVVEEGREKKLQGTYIFRVNIIIIIWRELIAGQNWSYAFGNNVYLLALEAAFVRITMILDSATITDDTVVKRET